jgi:hypothetical protein
MVSKKVMPHCKSRTTDFHHKWKNAEAGNRWQNVNSKEEQAQGDNKFHL